MKSRHIGWLALAVALTTILWIILMMISESTTSSPDNIKDKIIMLESEQLLYRLRYLNAALLTFLNIMFMSALYLCRDTKLCHSFISNDYPYLAGFIDRSIKWNGLCTAWDSCFHSIVYRWFDPKMAWEELQSLLVHQVKTGDDAGMIPHMAYLSENNDSKDQKIFQNRDSAAKFVLLFGKCVTKQQAGLLIKELFDENGYFHTPYLVPTTPTNNTSFNGTEYWRGNVWLPVNWLIYKGLNNNGFVEKAQKLTQNSLDLVANSGFYEFFNPLTGQGGKTLDRECPKN